MQTNDRNDRDVLLSGGRIASVKSRTTGVPPGVERHLVRRLELPGNRVTLPAARSGIFRSAWAGSWNACSQLCSRFLIKDKAATGGMRGATLMEPDSLDEAVSESTRTQVTGSGRSCDTVEPS